MKEDGIDFPMITLCNFNPIKKSYIKRDKALQVYRLTYPNFTVHDFFMKAGFDCEEMMMMCSFGGRQFNCCQYTNAILTNLGKCYTLVIFSFILVKFSNTSPR
ncbi:hypothetical protein DICVIV_03881 [Dictyocaulus viviparus]|uniref:Uncharacterized protein n=1 Tax=Dictyocaulus viviparus TaxID=29172 RepID=A0A0D8XZB7_DICVI|nr:hypothetical protein DICVIV_03881 [Dictyocaulus viviparus]